MRVFISSTAYDLADARDLCAEAVRDAGHDPVHHESIGFPQQASVHSHDRCILAVSTCDALVCLVDRRYGSPYKGSLRAGVGAQNVAGRVQRSVLAADLSITWLEVLEARARALPVMTFARQKTVDEHEIWKRNPRLKSLRLVHVPRDQYRIFDFLDWTTQRFTDNWIERFITLTDLRDRVLAWLRSITVGGGPTPPLTTAGPSGAPTPAGPMPMGAAAILVFVEGPRDAAFIQRLVRALRLRARVDVIAMGGRLAMLANATQSAAWYGTRYDAVIFLIDADTDDDSAARADLRRLRTMLEAVEPAGRSHAQLAVPTVDAWVAAISGVPAGSVTRPKADSLHLEQFGESELARAAFENRSLQEFIALLERLGSGEAHPVSIETVAKSLLTVARMAAAEKRSSSSAEELLVQLELQSSAEVEAAVLLEERRLGRLSREEGRWVFEFSDRKR